MWLPTGDGHNITFFVLSFMPHALLHCSRESKSLCRASQSALEQMGRYMRQSSANSLICEAKSLEIMCLLVQLLDWPINELTFSAVVVTGGNLLAVECKSNNINKLEMVQWNAARYVFQDFSHHSSPTSMIKELQCTSLARLIMMYQIQWSHWHSATLYYKVL